MTSPIRHILSAAAVFSALTTTTLVAAEDTDAKAIQGQLHRYEMALNASDAESVMTLYAADAVFMPQHSSPAVGRDAVRAAYDAVFKSIKLDVHFEIDEVRFLSSMWAYARTRSTGAVTVKETGPRTASEANQEFFLLTKEADGQWRFARYIFATTNPLPKPEQGTRQ